MRKTYVLFLIITCINCFSQNNVVFVPYFQTNKSYFLSIENNCGTLYKGKPKKLSHNIHSEKKVELRFLQELNQEKYYSWKFLEQNFIDNKYAHIDFLKNVEIRFKTTLDGRYTAISNLSNLENQIKSNIDRYVTKETLRQTKNKNYFSSYFNNISKDPTRFIKFLELEIINYFAYYNVSFNLGEQKFKTQKINFPFLGAQIPVEEVCNLVKSEKQYDLNIDCKFDKTTINDKHWDSLVSGPDFFVQDVKNNFDAQLNEKYLFSSLTGNAEYIEIMGTHTSILGKNYTLFNKFIYKLSE